MATVFTPVYLTRAVDQSLARMGVETIDALLLHSPSVSDLVDHDAEATLESLRRAGKIRYYGVSCDDSDCLREAMHFKGLSLLELPFDLIEAARRTDLWPAIAVRNIGVLAREVIRYQPARSPAGAVSNSLADGDVTCTVAGTSKSAHLDELAAALI